MIYIWVGTIENGGKLMKGVFNGQVGTITKYL